MSSIPFLHSPQEMAAAFVDWLRGKATGEIPCSGPCHICGAKTTDQRMYDGKAYWLCLYDKGDGLACYEVWQNRIYRADLPSYAEFFRHDDNDFYYSRNPSDYDILELPWSDERDEYHDYKTYIASREWNIKSWRAKVLARWTCQRCGRGGSFSTLHTHHKHYQTLYHERRQDVEVLCDRCHRREHGL